MAALYSLSSAELFFWKFDLCFAMMQTISDYRKHPLKPRNIFNMDELLWATRGLSLLAQIKEL